MSFFDEGDEPTRVSRPARPRRPAGARTAPATGGRGGGGRSGSPDRQTLLVRQGVALGIGLLVVILLVLGVRSCASSRNESALKDYNRAVTAVMASSDKEVMAPFFRLMSNGAREGQDLQVQINQLRQAADDDATRAQGFSVPGDMGDAQDELLQVLNFRRQGLAKIASQIPAAQGRGQASVDAIDRIAANMQFFLTSDVVHSQRVAPYIKEALDKNGVTGQTIPTSQSMRDIAWLSPQVVADRLGAQSATGTSGDTGGVAPGLHGHGLTSVAVGSVTLQPGQVVNRIPGSNPTFTVTFQNQGDNDERNVPVTLSVKPVGGGRTISARKVVPQTKAKSPASISIPLGANPPRGQPTVVTVVVGKVPGEKKTDNNRQTYTVIFQ